jgi:hypothetical protein
VLRLLLECLDVEIVSSLVLVKFYFVLGGLVVLPELLEGGVSFLLKN